MQGFSRAFQHGAFCFESAFLGTADAFPLARFLLRNDSHATIGAG